jgi:glucose dehydrogenase
LLCGVCAAQSTIGWTAYNGGKDGDHYSRLRQINRANVHELKVAWTFDTGEKGGIQTNPLIVGRTLFAYTPSQKVVALDAATGKLKWKFDAGIQSNQPNRGFAYWTDGRQARLFAGVMNFLYCLDPQTGKPITTFGENGRIDLRKGLRGDYEQQSVALTTPGMVYKDLIIVGGREPEAHPAPPGDIRAFDVHTGKLQWTFHTIPHPGEPGYDTWPKDAWKTAGSANNWSGMSFDAARGIVYVPTGSAVMDFYGGDRVGNDLYADTLLALDANTGKLLWYFQGVHHDIWDRDFPAPPALFTVEHNGKRVDALAQTTKQGYLYLFDRLTGKPLYPIHEHPYPASTVPGEVTSPTQPMPDWPKPFTPQELTENTLTNRTPEAHAWAVKAFHELRNGGQFYPFALGKQTVVYPGFDGGGEWGGPAVDPANNILYVNANDMAWTGGLVKTMQGGSPGAELYQSQCAMCHGVNRAGSPPEFPSLINIYQRLTADQVIHNIKNGKGRMPSFPNVTDAQIKELLDYLHTDASSEKGSDAKKEMPSVQAMGMMSQTPADKAGAQVYADHCAMCHGEHREGNPPSIPMLVGVGNRYTAAQVTTLVKNGKGLMPPAVDLSDTDLQNLLHFLGVSDHVNAKPAAVAEGADEYTFTGYRKFLDPDGYPAVTTPWGTLSAIDLKTGKYLWQIPLGGYEALENAGMAHTGSENYGGPIVTAGGVLFIGAAAHDRKFRAFNSRTGKLLWEAQLPYSGVATPSTYMVDGKQYVVIAASGGRDPKLPNGGAYVAYALPR